MRRSHSGAWIESVADYVFGANWTGRSHSGAWIERVQPYKYLVNEQVAPIRERGLKVEESNYISVRSASLPFGSVD